MSDPSQHYQEREQTFVKHKILQDYLEAFARIIGSRWPSITYIDGFSGPWKQVSEDYGDTSFAIAIAKLKQARAYFREQGRDVKIRCMFLEVNRASYARLAEYAKQVREADPSIEIKTLPRSFEEAIPDILSFVRDAPDTFPFCFIDPTGWSGFAMDTIEPLLRLEPGEVLINFMTSAIIRFIEHPSEETRASFEELFGSLEHRDRIRDLKGQDREDAIVETYAEAVRRKGGFEQVCSAIILNPLLDRTHFHLIYGTRHLKGIQKFKEAEKRAMKAMEEARADAQAREHEARTGQRSLFDNLQMHDTSHYDWLRSRYSQRSRRRVIERLRAAGSLPYDFVYKEALSAPLTWESDLKSWIADLAKANQLRLIGMKEGKRVPEICKGVIVQWTG